MTSDLVATGDTVRAASGRLTSDGVVADWEFAAVPDAMADLWDSVSPVAGLSTFTAALSQGRGPDPAVRLRVRAGDAYRRPRDEPPHVPGGPWASYTERESARRIHWPAREASATAGLLTASSSGLAGAGTAGNGHARTLVEVSASNESFRRKLFRMSLIAPLMLTGGVALVHGVALARDGFTVLLVGDSGAGKSTLGLAAFARGWHVVAEDLVFVSAGRNVVPLFLSGAWECRAHPADRALISRITGTELRGRDSGLPEDHRGRTCFFPVPASDEPPPVRPHPIDLLVFVDRNGNAPVAEGQRVGQVLGAGPRSTLGAVAKLLRLDFSGVVRETEETLRGLVDRLPRRLFAVSGRPADDVRAFLESLDRWADVGARS
ncbi:hypothetical protein ACFWP7_35155 [Streptomyces sp. NPDC058470]|uniref:hypothetical protein n=1 Tax=Streptomyces sp. NPDC058470 TaxID=3346515 RepID=UPI003659DAAF